MATYNYDLIIIGGGSAGLPAAQVAGALGVRTLLIDKERLGGECLHTGCVPSKALIHAARLVQQAKDAQKFGAGPAQPVDYAKVAAHIQQVIVQIGAAEEEHYVKEIDVRFGAVTFVDAHTLTLNDETLTFRNALIATGSTAVIPQIPGLAESGYLTNDTLFDLTALPPTLAIIGAGAIGVELAQALQRLGVQVQLIEAQPTILPKEDADIVAIAQALLADEGVTLHTNASIQSVTAAAGQKTLQLSTGQTVTVSDILIATGRRGNMGGLNLEQLGVTVDADRIHVNKHLQTSVKTIFAAGDVIGGYRFTHVAGMEGSLAASNALAPYNTAINYAAVPWVIFTAPEIAHVGLTEPEARATYDQIRVVTFPWKDIDRAVTDDAQTGLIKLIVTGKKERLVGAHLIGRNAGELLPELTYHVRKKGTLSDIMYTIHAYPTYGSGLQLAAFNGYLQSPTFAGQKRLLQRLNRWRW